MKSIVILSDTHGNLSAIEKILPILKESDYVFHLGDYAKDILNFNRELGDKIYSVLGNCDWGEEDKILEIEGVKIMLTHGHEYGVKNGLTRLKFKASELGVKAVFYGHTHNADIVENEGVLYINPGNMTRVGECSYCYCVVHDKKITATIVPIR